VGTWELGIGYGTLKRLVDAREQATILNCHPTCKLRTILAGLAPAPRMAAFPGRPDLPELLVATTKDWKQRKAVRERGCPRGRIPKDLGLRERMERKLLTKRGRTLYKKRGVLVEPVFGQMKEGQGFRRFKRRGLEANSSEAALVGTTHNLLKLWRSGRAPRS